MMDDLAIHILAVLVIVDLVLMVRRLDRENGDLRLDLAESRSGETEWFIRAAFSRGMYDGLKNSLPVRGPDGKFHRRAVVKE